MLEFDSASVMGPFCAFMSAVTWAVGSAVYGKLSQRHSPFAVNLGRILVALPVFLVLSLLTAREAYGALTWHHVGWFVASTLSSYVFADVLFFMSIRSLGLPGALAIASSYPLWSAVGGWVWNGQHLGPSKMAGLVATVTGTMLVILSHRGAKRAGLNHPAAGFALALVTSVLWAVNAFSLSRGGADIPSSVGNTIRMLVALVLSPLVGTLVSGPRTLWLGWADLKRAAPVFFIEAFGGSFFFMYGLTHAPLAVAASLASLSPVVSVPIAIAMGWERLNAMRAAGIALAVLGACLLLA